MIRAGVAVALLAFVALLGCAERAAPTATIAPLGGNVAQVGPVPVPASLVAFVAASQRKSPRVALEGIVEDALAAAGARARGYYRAPSVQWASTTVLARNVAEAARSAAVAAGPPADDELASLRIQHAVVRRSSAIDDMRAMAAADSMARAVIGARSDEEFLARAEATPRAGLLIDVEEVGPLDASGRGIDGVWYDPPFVAAAFALKALGDTSPVVETPYGWHVLRLVDRIRPDAALLESRRQELGEAIVELRARIRVTAVVAAQRTRVGVEVSAASAELMKAAVTALQ